MKLFKNFKLKLLEFSKKNRVVNLHKSNSEFKDVGDNRRLELRNIELLQFLIFILMFSNIALVIIILLLFPLKERVPYFVQFLPKDEQIVQIENFKGSQKAENQIKEYFARSYVRKREEINFADEDFRYTQIQFFSTNKVYQDFIDAYKDNPESPYKHAYDKEYVRHIEIISSSRLSDDMYQVEYEILDSKKSTGKIINNVIALATIKFVQSPMSIRKSSSLENPFNWVVDGYSISIKTTNERLKTEKLIKAKVKTESKKNGNEPF